MPACAQLFPKGQTEAATLVAVDEDLCRHFGVEPHPVTYFRSWYDNVLAFLAYGRDWAFIKELWCRCPEVVSVVEYLEANYTTEAWHEVK